MTFKPTDEQRYSVELMAGIGIKQDEIAAAVGIARSTLRIHFKNEIKVGRTRIVTRVADSLVRQALAGNITAAIFFLKTRGGWRDEGAAAAAGKKEIVAEQAKALGAGKFETPPSPKLVVDNG